MNGSSQLPQYTFDPVTQRYTLKTPAEQAREQQRGRSGLGSLYDGGADPMASSPPSSFSMSPETAVGMQNFGMAMQGIPSIAAQVAGAVATGIPSAFGYATPSPVANPSPIITAPIAPNPTQTLAAMNEASGGGGDEGDDGTPEGSVSIGAIGTEGLGEAGGPTSAADAGMGTGVGGVGDGGGGGGDGGGGDGGGDGGGNAAGDASAGAGDSSGEREGGMIYQKRYAEGGLASAARHVQSQGRGDDKVLVHMTPGEVRGLQAIAMQHGGSLTVNPETGLVEAGFLKNLLPMIAGAALAATGVGAPMAALMVGGGTALFTGSLEKGLMAGLGAFGGAGLGAGLGAAGATAPATTGTTAGLASQGAAGAQAAAASGGATAVPGALQTGGAKFLQAAGTQMPVSGALAAPASLAPAGSTAALQTAAAGAPQGFMANVSQMGKGLSNVVQGTPGAREAFMQSVGGPMGLATKAGGPLASAMFSAEEPDTGGGKPQEYIRPYGFDFNRADVDPEFRYRTGAPGESTAEQRYLTPTFTPMGVFKAGTEPGPSFYGTPTAEQYALYSKPKDSTLGLAAGGVAGLGKGGLRDGAFIVPADVVAHLGNGSNDAGQKLLARGLGARPIKGKGDGMSDSIPTSIEGKQPAKVADGEAYIPPEVVKKVGSKRLYDMMAKIRKARTNTTRQAPEVDPRKFMPA
jgi:hypothetical protein